MIATNRGYEPSELTVQAGETVTFVNRSLRSMHTAKDDPDEVIDGSPEPGPTDHEGGEINRASRVGFRTHALFPREAQKVVFPVARKYEYHCSFDPDMKGTINVVE